VVSGRVRAVAVHPADPLTVYIGAACGGLWKSTDGGNTWNDIGQNFESLTFGAIAIDSLNPNIVYAGSGESGYFTSWMHFAGSGLFKSIDGGQSWTQDTVSFGAQTHFSDIAVSPHNSNIVLAALASGNHYLGPNLANEGIWKTDNGGQSWIKTLNRNDAYDIMFHPTDSNLVYAGIGGMNSNSGFYVSGDQGSTWNRSDSGLLAPELIARIHIDISQSNPNILYTVIYEAGTQFNNGTTRVYKSINGGSSWNQISVGVNLGGQYIWGWADQGGYDLCIAVDPSNPDHVLIGNIELHITNDGANFSPYRPNGPMVQGSLVHADYHKLVFAPSNSNYLYIGCDGGVYLSTDGGSTANSKNNGLPISQFYRVAAHPTDPNIIMGGMQDNGYVRTTDGGATWNQVIFADGMEGFFDHTNPTIAYASMQMGRLYRSTDGGANFSLLPNPINGAWITPFFMHPINNDTLYSANKKVLSSTDEGNTFPPLNPANEEQAFISSMAQSKVNPDILIFATGMGATPTGLDSVIAVKVSIDGGFNWTDVTGNIPGETRYITRVVTDPVDANTIYVVRTGLSPGNKVYKSNDLGQTWTNISGNLPDLPCNDIFVDPHNTNHLYLANDIGVYFTDNGGVDWNYAGQGMPFVPVIDFDYGSGYLLAATHGRSIYSFLISGIKDETNDYIPIAYKLNQNYPNPFNPSTTIEFDLPKTSEVSLEIFNILGEEVITLISDRLSYGSYSYDWDAGHLASGVYLYRLKAEGFVQTKKMILIR
jgi:photosystem II stability/assembly factor-like uncharacterized protein